MSWDDVTLLILAAFGAVILLLTQITEVLSKLPDIIRAWREVQRALRDRPEEAPDIRGSHEPIDPDFEPVSGVATPRERPLRPTGGPHGGGQEPGCRSATGGSDNSAAG
ncbi:hypothetical protein [Streptomyces sp. SID1034]|uniref:hypothetical protein n=1 Tax=Streptomyces TaxID=1883 RepID=UPI001450660B|nr:hypothetical protein [Streptomyces sp. SID1034]MYV94210.1 hypothetical protein [Streptomyces sp. SID1034]